MTLAFLTAASNELISAAAYYEEKEAGLGIRFRLEVFRACRHILEAPYLWREHSGGYRRVNLPVFPYYVAYFIRGDRLIIAAVAHGHRRPHYWRDRLK